MISKLFKVAAWPATKVFGYVRGVNDALLAPTVVGEACSNSFVYGTKLMSASTGACGLGKGTADALEALVCQDGVCFVISCIGISADSLTIAASYVPGPNVTSLVTIPISIGCKSFVWACKKSKLPWKNC